MESRKRTERKRAKRSEYPAAGKHDCARTYAGHLPLLYKISHAYFKHGYRRCQCCDQQSREEQNRNSPTGWHLREDIRQSLKNKSRTGLRVKAERKDCRHYCNSGDKGKRQVRNSCRNTLKHYILLPAYI